MITIHAQGASLREIVEKFVDGVDTDMLMRALSARLEAEGQRLYIEPKAGQHLQAVQQPSPETTEQPSAASDKQQKAAAAAAAKKAAKEKAEAEVKAKAEADAKAKADAEAAAGGDDDFGAEDSGGGITIEDVKNALNDFKAKKGLVDARRIMVEQGGSSKLIDIPAEKYPAIISALKAAA
jgi:hypothetical protein